MCTWTDDWMLQRVTMAVSSTRFSVRQFHMEIGFCQQRRTNYLWWWIPIHCASTGYSGAMKCGVVERESREMESDFIYCYWIVINVMGHWNARVCLCVIESLSCAQEFTNTQWIEQLLFNADESTKMTPLIERKMKKITHRGEPNITCVFNFVLYLFVGTTGYWIWNSFHFQS